MYFEVLQNAKQFIKVQSKYTNVTTKIYFNTVLDSYLVYHVIVVVYTSQHSQS